MTSVIIILCILFFVIFVYFGVPSIYKRLSVALLKRRAVKAGVLVLTFDDGPGSHLTPAVLEILDRYDAKATFFLLGRNIMGRETIVRQITAAGHEICSHGYEHFNYRMTSPLRTISDVKRGWRAIDQALGKRDSIYAFRPPYGKLNLICLLYLLVRRVPIFYWTSVSGYIWPVDTQDSRKAAVLEGESAGTVVLAHDSNPTDEYINKKELDSISLALSVAKEKGMKVITLSELVGLSREI